MILNIYKPKGWTSFDVVAKVRSILREQTGKKKIKVGHAGTLDPLAEGVLLILTDYDTKKQDLLMKKPKEYLADIAFGATSPSYDLEKDVVFNNSLIEYAQLKESIYSLIPSYLGEIEQRVPPFSAVKVAGERLYKKARADTLEDIVIPTKRINIQSFEILDLIKETVLDNELWVLKCKVFCSSGTYLRSIAHDMGEDLKLGAVLSGLIRTRVGDHYIENSISMETIVEVLAKHPKIR